MAVRYFPTDDEKDPEINSKEWPWSLPRSVVLARYASHGGEPERGHAIYPPGTIAWAKKDDHVYPVIFGYEEKGYLIKKNQWMITEEELSARKLRSVDRVYEIINHKSYYQPEIPLDEYDPVPIYMAECKKLGTQPDKHKIEILTKLWKTYRRRHSTPF